MNIQPIQQWMACTRTHTVGDTIYIATATSRRKATVIGHKPGWILISHS